MASPLTIVSSSIDRTFMSAQFPRPRTPTVAYLQRNRDRPDTVDSRKATGAQIGASIYLITRRPAKSPSPASDRGAATDRRGSRHANGFSIASGLILTIATCARRAIEATAVLKLAFEGRIAAQDPNDEPASSLSERIRYGPGSCVECSTPVPRARRDCESRWRRFGSGATNGQIGQRVWNYCNVLRDDGLSYGDYVEQLTYLLFLKMADERTPAAVQPAIAIAGRTSTGRACST